MTSDTTYHLRKLKDIPVPELTNMIIDLVDNTILDYGRSIDASTHEHIHRRALEMLKSSRYSEWLWNEVRAAFELGRTGTYGGESRMSVANVERWLSHYSRGRAGRPENNAKYYPPLSPEEREESQWFAYAVHASLSRRMAGGKASENIRADVADLKRKYNNDLAKLPPIPRLDIAERFKI